MGISAALGIGLVRLCSELCLFLFSLILKEWPYYVLVSAYYASQVSQTAYNAPNYVEVLFFSHFHIHLFVQYHSSLSDSFMSKCTLISAILIHNCNLQ